MERLSMGVGEAEARFWVLGIDEMTSGGGWEQPEGHRKGTGSSWGEVDQGVRPQLSLWLCCE